MREVNIRIGKRPYNDNFECTINGIDRDVESTLILAMKMQYLGIDSQIIVDGLVYVVTKFAVENGRIIAEARARG